MQLSGKLTDLLTYLVEDAWPSEDAWITDVEPERENTHTVHTAPKRQLVKAVKEYVGG